MIIRKTHCSNWYPQSRKEILGYFEKPKEKIESPITFLISPHAGWIYSGKVAGSVFSLLKDIDTAIILATNHTGLGPPSSLFPEGIWEMPLGSVAVDSDFTKKLLHESKELKKDLDAHLYEHAIEVQLPFLQMVNPHIKIVPIEMKDYRFETASGIASSLARAILAERKKNPQKRFCVIASTDMTHCGDPYGQLPPERTSADAFARAQDQCAIEHILKLEGKKLLETVRDHTITMCGSGPCAAVLETARTLGAKSARVAAYATSADVTGKGSEFAVGYAGIVIQ